MNCISLPRPGADAPGSLGSRASRGPSVALSYRASDARGRPTQLLRAFEAPLPAAGLHVGGDARAKTPPTSRRATCMEVLSGITRAPRGPTP